LRRLYVCLFYSSARSLRWLVVSSVILRNKRQQGARGRCIRAYNARSQNVDRPILCTYTILHYIFTANSGGILLIILALTTVFLPSFLRFMSLYISRGFAVIGIWFFFFCNNHGLLSPIPCFLTRTNLPSSLLLPGDNPRFFHVLPYYKGAGRKSGPLFSSQTRRLYVFTSVSYSR